MNLRHTVIALALVTVWALPSCSGDLEAENAQLKTELKASKAQLKEQIKLSDFAKEQATTARRRADEAEKALAECNNQ